MTPGELVYVVDLEARLAVERARADALVRLVRELSPRVAIDAALRRLRRARVGEPSDHQLKQIALERYEAALDTAIEELRRDATRVA
jgi:uncharacterized protein YjiS (DUF1127 family)